MQSGAASWTVRTIEALESVGWMCERVEHWNPFSRRKHDLFNVLDVLAVRPGYPTRGIQVCSHGDGSTRMRKMLGSANVGVLLAAGWWLEVWGWKKDGKIWVPVIRNVGDEIEKRGMAG